MFWKVCRPMKYDSVGGRSRRLIDLVVVIVVRTIRKKAVVVVCVI